MSRGRQKKTDSDNVHSAYYENIGSYFELILRLFGEEFRNQAYSNLPQQVLDQNSLSNNEREELFTLPSNWIWCTIGDIVEVAKNRNIEEELNSKVPINYIDIDSIDNKHYKVREVKQKTVGELSSRARRVLKKEYVIYSLVRPYLNNLAIIEEDKENLIGSTGFAAFKCIGAVNEYVKFWLLSSFIRKRYLGYMSGFNSPGISSGQFYLTPIPLPPIEEQVVIVDLIKSLENEDSLNNKDTRVNLILSRIERIHSAQENCLKLGSELTHQLSLVKQLRHAFLREAMQGKLVPQDANDEPASELLKKIKAEKEQLIKEKKIKKEKGLPPIKAEEIPFEIPKSWMWCRLGEIAYIASGSTPKQDAFTKNGVPYLKMYNLKNQKIEFDYRPQYIKREIHEGQLKRSRAFPGDVIMNIVGPPLGKLAIVPNSLPECNFNQAGVLIRCYELQINKWIYWYLNEPSEIFSIVTKGAAGQDNISVTQSNNMRIPVPPIPEQHRIVAKLEQLMRYCDELEQSIKESQTQNEQLLQQVLREALQPTGKYKLKEEMSIVSRT